MLGRGLFVAFLLIAGACATGETGSDDGAGPAGASTSGSGGDGGDMPTSCDSDCSDVATDACFIAECNEGQHDGPIGECVVVVDVDAPCDDGLFCTVGDVCDDSGTCQSGPDVNDCGITPPNECNLVVCNEASEDCSFNAIPDGGDCIHTNLCLSATTCQNGDCVGGVLEDCTSQTPPDECHILGCNPMNGMCEAVAGNDGAPCIDPNDLCSTGQTCNNGMCQNGMLVDCSHLDVGCEVGVCDPMDGMCAAQPVMNGVACDDMDACTAGETCTAGMCGGGAAVTICSQTSDGCCPPICAIGSDADCCSPANLTTNFMNTTGWDGIMFDVVATTALEIKTVDVNLDVGMKNVEIYYKAGTYQGFANNPAAWTLVGSAAVNPSMTNVGFPIPINIDLVIPAGQRYGLYITTTNGGTVSNGLNYIWQGGPITGQLWTSDANLQIYAGQGQGYPFTGSSFMDRALSGTIHYEACGP